MPPLDMIPALRKRDGRAPRRSGERLSSDLHTVRHNLIRLISIINTEAPREAAAEAETLTTVLLGMLTEIDGVDPNNPPPADALELFSHRVSLVSSAIKLMMQKQVFNDLTAEPAAPPLPPIRAQG